jgi:hypothetical protein
MALTSRAVSVVVAAGAAVQVGRTVQVRRAAAEGIVEAGAAAEAAATAAVQMAPRRLRRPAAPAATISAVRAVPQAELREETDRAAEAEEAVTEQAATPPMAAPAAMALSGTLRTVREGAEQEEEAIPKHQALLLQAVAVPAELTAAAQADLAELWGLPALRLEPLAARASSSLHIRHPAVELPESR